MCYPLFKEKAQYGLWEKDHLIKYFDEDEIKAINNGDTSWKSLFQDDDSINSLTQCSGFTKPEGFKTEIIKIKKRIKKRQKKRLKKII
mmetsp:Transcript_18212/g.16100  ORF Transcript_18212/g.16100 Transcript_18212/m.16100 type:complete len:88 (+) Transcript_18212:327-590(+)